MSYFWVCPVSSQSADLPNSRLIPSSPAAPAWFSPLSLAMKAARERFKKGALGDSAVDCYGRERCKAVPCQRMRYYPRQASLFWVDVVVSKGDVLIKTRIKTRKYRGEEPVMPGCRPSGAVPWATCPSSSVLSALVRCRGNPRQPPGAGPRYGLSNRSGLPKSTSGCRYVPSPFGSSRSSVRSATFLIDALSESIKESDLISSRRAAETY